ncbi:MAG: hypothetical protein CVV44_01760 [Spirochaetae bacterium HGW-Spirochaetae-1]|nr:MAG: hypothetical protein CVV44_01760 [Spirochaetae bacterium HGW-Spirochaetae-1]
MAASPLHPGESLVPYEVPRLALKHLADSTVDPCPVCVEKLKKRAFKALDKSFPAGAVVCFDDACPLVKTKDCGRNELVPACSRVREEYRGREEQLLQFPLMLFRFHTRAYNLVGIGDKDYSSDTDGQTIEKLKTGSSFTGKLRIISYEYGDGASFNYSAQRNVVIIHCQLLDIIKIVKK